MPTTTRGDLASRALLWYTEHVPWHRGKRQVVDAVKNAFDLRREGDHEVARLNLRWVLNPNDYGEGQLFWAGAYDIWERFHITRLIAPDAVIFDIGANYGLYSLSLASALGSTATVHSFEPNPVTYARLARNISLNPKLNVQPHQLALADWDGTGRIIANETNSGASSIGEGEGALVTTLDRFCEQQQIRRLDFMKVDIEGFEPRLLRGGTATLQRFKPMIQIELNPPVLLEAGSSVEQLLGELRALEYEFYLAKRNRLLPMTSLPDEPDFLVNCFCVHAQNRPAGL